MPQPSLLIALLVAAAGAANAQGVISGTVRDTRGDALPEADVQVQSESTGTRWKTQSEDRGRYSISGLSPDRYKITVRLPGFRTVARGGVALDSAGHLPLDFTLDLLGLHQVITVTSGKEELDPSAGESLILTRTSPGAALPANGSDFRASFDLLPGIVVTPAGVSDGGQFTSNGQRPNANMFRVDGASANIGVGGTILPGSFPGASLPAMSAIGSTENLGSPESTQSVELRPSSFAPASGTRPGAEALVVTRSGSNQFHGEFFGHVRDNGWSARDWFANSVGYAYQRPSYNSVGGVLGGPIRRNRTFFFASVERSVVTDTGIELITVPSNASRQNAPDKLKAMLDSFPQATGPDLGGGEAEAIFGNNSNAHLRSFSLRGDQSLGTAGNLFARLVVSPSTGSYLQNNWISSNFNWISATFGLTVGRSEGFIHDLRLNYSRATLSSADGSSAGAVSALVSSGLLPGVIVPTFTGSEMFTIGPGPGPIFLLGPPGSGSNTILGLSVPGLGQFVSNAFGQGRQDQWELRHTLSRRIGSHEFRAGLDYTLLRPSRNATLSSVLGVASSLEGLLANDPLAITVSEAAQYGGQVNAISMFAQDTARLSDSLNIVYGLRWEMTPPTASQPRIPTITGLWTGTDWQTTHYGDINGTAPWPMRYRQLAPRIGLAWRLPWRGLVLRAAGGLFYDPTLGASINPINGAPFNTWLLAGTGPGIDSSTGSPGTSQPSQGTSADVQRFLSARQPPLHLPASYQWRVSLEKRAGGGVASAAYVGATGRNLLGNQAYIEPDTGILDRQITLTEGSSNYQAAQFRYSGTLARNLYGSVSYTWSHSIDDGSNDSSLFLIHPGYQLSDARGSSSFDIRQELTAALSYRMHGNLLPEALRHWTVSGILRARSGFPIDVLSSQPPLGQGFDNAGRPDLVPGVSVWIADASVAGHRRLNPAAFRAPSAGITGSLGRNVITGNGLAQLDVSLRREFPLFRQLSLEVSVNVFNVLNHPAFANPVSFLSSPFFGRPTSMQNLMLGSGTPNTGLPPLFQTGGARAGEFSFRFTF
ncbi:MAG TPA: carboxypeptidase-like regulatory domain-containing protein [Bryobacteraceae bacterium]|nr:carboxypeptidase-like regulatory domain-containing protein [Bryobacteraceae bacterium]